MDGKRLCASAAADHKGPEEHFGRKRSLATALLGVCLLALATSACGVNATAGTNENHGGSKGGANSATCDGLGHLPQGSERVKLDPANFTTRIDNHYWPMSPGSKWVYTETDTKGTKQKVVVEVTHKTKMIANGVEARVVRDTATENGEITEQTDDWYAQDKVGNIWYMGEATAEYKNGKIETRAGSFEAGVEGAQPGIAMPADPEPGLSYRQEYYKGEAEDKAAFITTVMNGFRCPSATSTRASS